jgi:DNA-binding response OmpR family regulator
MKKILIVEDDASIAEIERDFLEIEGYEVKIVTDGQEGLDEALTKQYDLILLDLMLPGIDGLEICKRIRGALDIPIIMATAKGEDRDKVRGLGIGADDYISKPFLHAEFVARVKANLAQYERIKAKTASEEIQIGGLCINEETRRLHLDGREIDCKNKEFDLLLFLMQNPEIVFSKETLYDRVWGMDAFGDLKTVAVHINRLREKIEKDPADPQHIQTVWGAGYRLKL